MLNWKRIVAALILGGSASIAAPMAADERVQDAVPPVQAAPTGHSPAPVKTGKERLSGKASDEQRVDNCKVPQEMRGTTVRSDTCVGKSQAIPTN